MLAKHYGVFSYPPIMPCPIADRKKGKKMAEPRETRQEQEARWDAQRAAREQEFQAGRHARQQKNRRIWVTLGAIVLLVAVIAAVVLL